MKIQHTLQQRIFHWLIWMGVLGPLVAWAGPASSHWLAAPSSQGTSSKRWPLAFEQADANHAQFIARGRGFIAGVDGQKLHLAIYTPEGGAKGRGKGSQHNARQASLWMELASANKHAEGEVLNPLPGVANYLMGDDPATWRLGVQTYAQVLYRQVYPGIDLTFHGFEGQLQFDFLLAPGAHPEAIRLRWHGCRQLSLDAAGNLVLGMEEGKLVWKKPFAFQEIYGERKEVPCEFLLTSPNQVEFSLGTYDSRLPLVIDPVLIYSTFLGGNDLDAVGENNGFYPAAGALAVDRDGGVYLTGRTLSTNFFRSNAYQTSPAGNNDLFVTKLNSNGTAVIFSTYLGGSGHDFGYGIALDSNRNIYLTGSTDSSNFPRANAAQNTLGGGGFPDSFLLKLNPGGTSLLYSTFLGGGSTDSGNAVAVDNSGNAYVAGDTFSEASFPRTTTRFQSIHGGAQDAFVAKFNTTASGAASLVYASWLGGTDDERANGIAIDSAGNAYVTGETFHYGSSTASSFPVNNAIYPTYAGGNSDGFIAKINTAGSAKIFSTFFGGAGDDYGWDIALDSAHNLYVVGETSSTNFHKTLGAAQPGFASGYTDGYLMKLGSNGLSLLYSTYLGGTQEDGAAAVAVDSRGVAYVAGYTASLNYPVTPDAYKTTQAGEVDAFLTVLNPTLTGAVSLVFSTYFGGPEADYGLGVTVDSSGSAFISGLTSSTNFSVTPGAFQANYGGGESDAFVARFGVPADLAISQFTSSPSPASLGSNLTYTIVVTNLSRSFFTNVTVTNRLPPGMTFVNAGSSRGSCSQNAGIVTCSLGTMTNNDAAILTINVTPGAIGPATSLAAVLTSQSERDPFNNLATNITVVHGAANLSLDMALSPGTVYVNSNTVLTLRVTNNGPQAATSVLLTNVIPAGLNVTSIQSSHGSCTLSGSLLSCALLSLNHAASATVTVMATGASPGTWTGTAGVLSAELDPNPGNNSSNVHVEVSPMADLQLTQTMIPASAFAGSNLMCSILVTNSGPSAASGVTLNHLLSPGLSVISAQPSQGACSISAQGVTCSMGNLSSNGFVSVTLTLRLTGEGTQFLYSDAQSQVYDPVLTNNTASALTVFPGLPALNIQRLGTDIVLSWPTNWLGFSVQYRTNLNAGGPWSNLPGPPQVSGTHHILTHRINAPVNFFRLVK